MISKNKTMLINAGIFLFLFLIVALVTLGTQGFLLDETVAYWAEANNTYYLGMLMAYASFIGSSEVVLIATILIGLILIIKRNWRHFLFFFAVSVGSVVLNLVLKLLIHRERPGDEVSYIEVFNLNIEIQSYSFPSGHTMRTTILFLFLIYLTYYFVKKTMIKYIAYVIFIVLICAVALSRIILDAHFITDVVGAILVSISWFFLCGSFFHEPKRASTPIYLHR